MIKTSGFLYLEAVRQFQSFEDQRRHRRMAALHALSAGVLVLILMLAGLMR